MLNLHQTVRSAITGLHPDESALLVQAIGQSNERGVVVASYAKAASVRAQVQSPGSDELTAMEETARTGVSRKAYLFSATPSGLAPAGIIRPLARDGDLMRRADGTWWLVTSVMEDFTASGWVCVGVTLQEEIPAEAEEKAREWDAGSHD